jgi:hypothetical protein
MDTDCVTQTDAAPLLLAAWVWALAARRGANDNEAG